MRIDLNADLAEGVTDDTGLLAIVTSANVACGFHAGDAETMLSVCTVAAERGIAIGAQVSYADREGFGRRQMEVSATQLRGWVADQVGLLTDIARRAGTDVTYVKPHGALYNRVVEDADQAAAVLDGSGELPVLGLPDAVILRLAAERGRRVVAEGFPDRGYTGGRPGSGHLLPRDRPGALVTDPEQVAGNAVHLARSQLAQTVCVHGDSPGAVQTADRVRRALLEAGFELGPWAD